VVKLIWLTTALLDNHIAITETVGVR